MALLRKQFGQRLMGEAMQKSIDGALNKHLKESGDRPAAQPAIKMTNEDWKEGDDINVEVSYERLPDVPETDFSKIKLDRMVVEADDEAINEALENLAGSAKTLNRARRVQRRKRAIRSFWTSLARSMVSHLTVVQRKTSHLSLALVRSFPGFEDQLIGVKAGEEKAVEVTFP